MNWALEYFESRLAKQLDMLRQLSEEIAQINFREISPNGEVVATVNGECELVGLELSNSSKNLTPEQLSTMIVETSHLAATAAMGERAQLIENFHLDFAEEVGRDVEPEAMPEMSQNFEHRKNPLFEDISEQNLY